MEQCKSNLSFGMAFHSPTKANMKYFKRYIANNKGEIDTKALGDFVIRQADNQKVDLRFKHTDKGDVFEIFSTVDPKQFTLVPCKNIKTEPSTQKTFMQKLKTFLRGNEESFKYKPDGNPENLPKEMRQAGEIANKMEKELNV